MRGENYDIPHDESAETAAVQFAIEIALANFDPKLKDAALQKAARRIAQLDAKYGGCLDEMDSGMEALERIKNFCVNKLPQTIDGDKMHENAEFLIEQGKSDGR